MRRGLHMTPDLVEEAYSTLRITKPFDRWRMPHPDQVQFRVLVTRERYGHYRAIQNDPTSVFELAVSTLVTNLDLLHRTVAHEMTHHRQEVLGHRDVHGPHFQRLAAQVCRHHGFDPAQF